ELKNLGAVTTETKKVADEAMIKHNEIAARITEIEQKLVRSGSETKDARKSNGQIVTDHEDFKAFVKSGGKGRVSIAVKAIISALTTDADGSAGDLIVPDRQGMINPVVRRMTVRDLLTPGRTNSNAIQYVKES